MLGHTTSLEKIPILLEDLHSAPTTAYLSSALLANTATVQYCAWTVVSWYVSQFIHPRVKRRGSELSKPFKKNPDTPSSQAGVKMIYCRLVWQPSTLYTLWEEPRDYWKMHSERTLTPEMSKAYTQGNCYPSVVSPLVWDAMTCNIIPALWWTSAATDCGSRNLCLQVGKQQESLLGRYCDYTVTMTLAADPISHFQSLKRNTGFMAMYWAALLQWVSGTCTQSE